MTLQATHVPDLNPSPSPAPPAPEIAAPAPRRSFLARLRREDSGQDLIEYALTAAMIGLTAVSGMTGLAGNIANTFDSIGSTLTNSISTGSGGGNNNNGGDGDHHGHGDGDHGR